MTVLLAAAGVLTAPGARPALAATGWHALRPRAPLPPRAAPPPSSAALSRARANRPDRFSAPRRAAANAAKIPTGTWEALGPAAIGNPISLETSIYYDGAGVFGGYNAGRIDALVQLPSGTHAGRIVAATAGGGVWTYDTGVYPQWKARTDTAPSLAVGSLALDPSNANHLIAGTGEALGASDSYYGFGVLSSTDGGNTWATQDPGKVFDGLAIASVAIDPSNAAHMFAATTGGLFVTSDGGTTWAKPSDASYTPINGNLNAVVIDPVTPSIVYIAGGPALVGRSTDGGVHWSAVNLGITPPAPGPCSFIALALAATSPSTLYASVGTGCSQSAPVGLYRTVNGGGSWTPVTAPDYTGNAYAYGSGSGEQGNYDDVVAVDPTNAAHLLAGGETVVESTDGGSTWSNVNGQTFNTTSPPNPLHPDQHALWFTPSGSVLIGNDGGVYAYGAGKISNLNVGLGVTQFYFGISGGPEGGIMGGAQDNSTTFGRPAVPEPVCCPPPSGAILPNLWEWAGLNTGDGGPTAETMDYATSRWYALYESDQKLFSTTNLGPATDITPFAPNGSNAPFVPPMTTIANPLDAANPTVFYGAADVWRTANPSGSPPAWTKVTSVGTVVSALAVSPSNPQVVYAGFQDGTIQVSTDGGLTFTSLAAQPIAGDTYVTGLSVDPTNPQSITASFSYAMMRIAGSVDTPHVAQYTYATTPGTGTWTVITGDLPGQAGVSRVIYDGGALVAATDTGVYATGAPAGANTVWTRVGKGMPNAQTVDLLVDAKRKVLFAATHGRGIWELHPPVFGAAVSGYNGDGEYGIGDPNVSSTQPIVVSTPPGQNVTAVGAGGAFELAVLVKGRVIAWGANDSGQLGNGTITGSTVPVRVSLPAGVSATAVAAGTHHSLALLSNGAVLAWGANGNGQLGNGSFNPSDVPVQVALPAGSTVKAIAAGGATSLALLSDGTVLAWGQGSSGQLGDGSNVDSDLPVRVALPAGSTATSVAEGATHSLAVLNDGSVWAWGSNGAGELGNNSNTPSAVPVRAALPAGSVATSVAAGVNFSLTLLGTGAVFAWGINNNGELGNGTTTASSVPVQAKLPAGASRVTAIAAGAFTGLALMKDGGTLGWGSDAYSIFGNDAPASSSVPVYGCPASCRLTAIAASGYDAIVITDETLVA